MIMETAMRPPALLIALRVVLDDACNSSLWIKFREQGMVGSAAAQRMSAGKRQNK